MALADRGLYGVRSARRLRIGKTRSPALEATGRKIVLSAQEPELAVLAVAQFRWVCHAPVLVLEGGNGGWRGSGFEVVTEPACLLSEPLDRWLQSTERPNPRQVGDYLEWEIELLELIEQGDRVGYRNRLWR